MDSNFYKTTNILNTLKANGELAKFFKEFIKRLIEYRGLEFIELFDYKSNYNADEKAYEVYCGVSAARSIQLPNIHNKFLINDYYCYLVDNKKTLDLTKFWQAFCKMELSPNLLELWEKEKNISSYYNIYKPIKRS